MHAYEHLRHRSSKFLVTIEHYAKEGTCIYMNICVTVALGGGGGYHRALC